MTTSLTALEAAVDRFDEIQFDDKSENSMGKPGFEEAAELLWAALPLTNPPDLLWLAGFRVERGRKKLMDMELDGDEHVRLILLLGRGHSSERAALHERMKGKLPESWRAIAQGLKDASKRILEAYRAAEAVDSLSSEHVAEVDAEDDWISATEAFKLADEIGYPIALSTISKAPKKQPPPFRTRRARPGQPHRIEVYQPEFLIHLVRLHRKQQTREVANLPPLTHLAAAYAAEKTGKQEGRAKNLN